MDKYTYSNLIIDPTKEGIESLIGKEVYFSDIPNICLENANKNDISYFGTLERIRKDGNNPFMVKSILSTTYWSCIIPKKEEPKPKYVPFKNQKEFLGAYQKFKENIKSDTFENNLADYGIWVKDKNEISCSLVIEIWNEGVALGGDTQSIYWRDLFEYYTFPDGSACGKREGE